MGDKGAGFFHFLRENITGESLCGVANGVTIETVGAQTIDGAFKGSEHLS